MKHEQNHSQTMCVFFQIQSYDAYWLLLQFLDFLTIHFDTVMLPD